MPRSTLLYVINRYYTYMTILSALLLSSCTAVQAPVVLDVAIDQNVVSDVQTGAIIARTESITEALQVRLAELRRRHGRGAINLPMRTAGGLQCWGDRCWDGGWRIQENVLTGHCRLLAPNQVRQAWGSYAACQVALEERRLVGAVPTTSGHLVILVHGLLRSHGCLDAIGAALAARGVAVARLSYPSTRQGLAEHATRLRELLDGLHGISRVSFVTHSLGALVVRTALEKPSPHWPTLGRAAFCFPPNQGSARADAWSTRWIYRVVMGPVGQEVTTTHAPLIPLPTLPFAVIAGTGGNNRTIPGPDDGTVGVAETWLPGAERWDIFPVKHTFGMNAPEVITTVGEYILAGQHE